MPTKGVSQLKERLLVVLLTSSMEGIATCLLHLKAIGRVVTIPECKGQSGIS